MNTEGLIDELEKRVKKDLEIRLSDNPDGGLWGQIDKDNTAWMKEFIEHNGWPKISVFGEIAAHNAWLLVQHADLDVDFQEKCLELMQNLPREEVSQTDIAYLTDRVLMKRKGLQRYGTQYFEYPDYMMLQPLEDNDKVEDLRKEVGLDTIEKSLGHHHKPVYVIERKLILSPDQEANAK